MAAGTPAVTATYTGPSTSAPFTVQEPLQRAHPSPGSVEERTAYLANLRSVTEAVQDRINTELTLRMEEDKAREAVASGKAPISAEQEAEEEQNYGEEAQAEED